MRSTSEIHDANGVAAFLLLDRLFPRSVLFSLNLADTCLFEIQPVASASRRPTSLARAWRETRPPRVHGPAELLASCQNCWRCWRRPACGSTTR